jgi:hypothetical protein
VVSITSVAVAVRVLPVVSVEVAVTVYDASASAVGRVADQLVPVTVAATACPPTDTDTLAELSATVPVSVGVVSLVVSGLTVTAAPVAS